MTKTRTFLAVIIMLTFGCSPVATGIEARSGDGAWHLSVSGSPQVLLISAAGSDEPLRRYTVEDRDGEASEITCLLEAPSRQSFFAVLASVGEIWEMSYDPDADPVFPGFVHNYRIGQVEGIEAEPQPFARRRLRLALEHQSLLFSPDRGEVIGWDASGDVVVFNLDARRKAGTLSERRDALPLQGQFLSAPAEVVFVLPFENGDRLGFSARTWHSVDTLPAAGSTPVQHIVCQP